MELAVGYLDSVVGRIKVTACSEGITGIDFPVSSTEELQSFRSSLTAAEIVDRALGALERYFSGKTRKFSVPLVIHGTEFQRSVWKALAEIPFGETRSYRDIATAIGNPGAARAIGQANGKNPLPIIIPCHRVIAADQSLGGYAMGQDRKRELLALEGITLQKIVTQNEPTGGHGERSRMSTSNQNQSALTRHNN